MPTQSRERSINTGCQAYTLLWNGSSYVWMKSGGYIGRTCAGESSTITGYRGPRRPGVINSCSHTKIRVQPIFASVRDGATSKLDGVRPIGCGLADGNRVTAFGGFVMSDTDKRELIALMGGEIPPIMSVPNLILELPQTLSLWSQLKQPLLELVQRVGSARGRMRSGSTALLAQQFGLFPLIGDLTTLLTSTRSIHSEVLRFTKRPDTWTSTKLALSPRSNTASLGVTSAGFGFNQVRVTNSSVEAFVHFKHRKAMTLDGSALSRAIGRQLYGFSNPAAVLWEATPFSFVGDWFFPIGDYLNDLDKSSFRGSMQCKEICTTVKTRMHGEVYQKYSSFPEAIVALVEATVFQRTPGMPSSSTPFSQITGPNVKQSILGSALLLQK